MTNFFRNKNDDPAAKDGSNGKRRSIKLLGWGIAVSVLAVAAAGTIGMTGDLFPEGAIKAALVTGGQANAQEATPSEDSAEPASDQNATTTASSSGDDPFVDHVRQAGSTSCATLLPVLGSMLTTGSTYTVQTNWSEGEGDSRPIQSLVGMNYETEAYDGPAAGFVLADPKEESCDGAMVRVVPFQGSCEEAAALLPDGSQPLQTLSDVRSYALGDGGSSLMIPGENSCVVVSIATASTQNPTEN